MVRVVSSTAPGTKSEAPGVQKPICASMPKAAMRTLSCAAGATLCFFRYSSAISPMRAARST
jgi:hypothetical protein